MRLILMGAPGAGKGTQAGILCEALEIPAISTGDILRTAMKDGTELGRCAKDYINAGQLVPDELIIKVIDQRLHQEDCERGYILDGVPRTVNQAMVMEQMGFHIDAVVSMEVSDEALAQRISGRRICSECGAIFNVNTCPPVDEGVCDCCAGSLLQRNDDKAETVKSRLEVYHQQTKPVEDFYQQRGLLKSITVEASIEDMTQRILQTLKLSSVSC